MNRTTILDRLRARARGQLTRAEHDELERELGADPALRALAEDFALVHALTSDERPVPAPRTRFEDLRLGERTAPRRLAAAAAVLLLSGAAFVAGRLSARRETPLSLATIELRPPAGLPLVPADLPAQWSDFDPRGANGVRFLSDLGEAERLARVAQRPLLVYGSYPGCPMCAALDARVFSDPGVIGLAERTVPVRVNLADLPEAEQRALTARGYPFLEMWREDGRTTHSLARNPDPALFVESLHDGLAKSDAVGEQRPWEELRGLARRFEAARAAELEGRLAEAERGFRALATASEVPAPVAEVAQAGLRRLADSARELLFEARASAQADPAAARRVLEQGLERFRGSSFEPDLRAALERLVREGRFPQLVEADRSA